MERRPRSRSFIRIVTAGASLILLFLGFAARKGKEVQTTAGGAREEPLAAGSDAIAPDGVKVEDCPCLSHWEEDGHVLWPEPWASQTSVQAETVGLDARVAALGRHPDDRPAEVIQAIDHLLRHAHEASVRRRWRPGLLDRWRGTSLERAHYNLHAAKVLSVDLLSEPEIDALIPSAIARIQTVLAHKDPRRIHIESELTVGKAVEEKRAWLKQALYLGYDAVDQHHARLRGFRNLLIIASVVITIFVAALIMLVAVSPSSMPLCFEPAPPAGEVQQLVCPSGHQPLPKGSARIYHFKDVLIVAGLGLLGGAVAAVFAIRKVRGTSTPYDIPLALAVLKAPTGALTAIVGILLVGGGFIPGLSELDSQRQILAYALLFGYAQQLATRLIDNQAQAILNRTPSKDSKGKQPKVQGSGTVLSGQVSGGSPELPNPS